MNSTIKTSPEAQIDLSKYLSAQCIQMRSLTAGMNAAMSGLSVEWDDQNYHDFMAHIQAERNRIGGWLEEIDLFSKWLLKKAELLLEVRGAKI